MNNAAIRPRNTPGNERNIVQGSSNVRRKCLSQSLYETLRDRIISGEYPADSRLPAERELVEMFGVNRGAVREAIQRLAQAKLIVTTHGGGSRVEDYLATAGLDLLVDLVVVGNSTHRLDAVRSLIEMRTALAVDAARLAALNRTPTDLAAIRALSQDIATLSDNPDNNAALQEQLLALWESIINASGNIAYRLAFNTLRDGYRLFGKIMHKVVRESFHAPDYRFLISAIADGDTARAERGARRIVEKDALVFLARISA